MKQVTFLISLLLTCNTYALSYRCTSKEKVENRPVFILKVNPRVMAISSQGIEPKFLIGVSPAAGERFVVYTDGVVDDREIMFSFIEDLRLSGYLHALSSREEGVLEGTTQYYKFGKDVFHIRCVVEKDTFQGVDENAGHYTLELSSMKVKMTFKKK
jgi:hypothetical protein